MNSNSIAQPAENSKTAAQERMERANYLRMTRIWERQQKRLHAVLVEQHRLFGGIFEDEADLETA